MSCPRVSYRRRMHYATRGNRMKLVRTPGNRLVMQKRTKRSQGVHTPWVLGHKRLGGTKAFHHLDARLASRHRKSVSRAYGGVLSHAQVRDRVVRAFLVEEQRVVKQALAAHAKFQRNKKRAANKKKKAAAVAAKATAAVSSSTLRARGKAASAATTTRGKATATSGKSQSQPRRQPVGAVLASASASSTATKAKNNSSSSNNNNNNSSKRNASKATTTAAAAASRAPVGAKLAAKKK